jgi:hypothetical protein
MYIIAMAFYYGFNFFIFFVIFMMTIMFSIFINDYWSLLGPVDYAFMVLSFVTFVSSFNMIRNFVANREQSRFWGIFASGAFTTMFAVFLIIALAFGYTPNNTFYFVLTIGIGHLICLLLLLFPKTAVYYITPPPYYNPEPAIEEANS